MAHLSGAYQAQFADASFRPRALPFDWPFDKLRAPLGHRRGQAAPSHIWLGVSVENNAALTRLRHLQQTNASVRFVSFEPLLGPIGAVDLEGIHWVIAGGESGPGARPVRAEWVRALRNQCQAQRVAFFFKQWGGRTPKAGGNTLDGRQWLEYPEVETGPGLASTPTPRRQFMLPPVIPSSRQA